MKKLFFFKKFIFDIAINIHKAKISNESFDLFKLKQGRVKWLNVERKKRKNLKKEEKKEDKLNFF